MNTMSTNVANSVMMVHMIKEGMALSRFQFVEQAEQRYSYAVHEVPVEETSSTC